MSLLGDRCSCLRTAEEGCVCADGPPEATLNLDDDTPLACPLRTGPDDEPCESCQ